MRITHYSLSLVPAVLAAAALTSQPALAADAAAHIPFSFVVSGMTLPAGDYVLHEGTDLSTVSLESPKLSLVWIDGPGSPNPSDQRVILTFDRVGETLVLRTVQYGPMITSRLDKKYMKEAVESAQIAAVRLP